MKKCAISGLDHPRIASRGAARSSTPSRNCRNCNFRGLSVIASQRAALMRGRTADYAVANPPYGPGLCSSALRSRIRAGLVGPRVRGQGRCRDDPLWPGVCFAPSRARALLRVRSVRLISEGIAAVVQGRIAEAVAADTGRCRPLCQTRNWSCGRSHPAGKTRPRWPDFRSSRQARQWRLLPRRARLSKMLSSSSLHGVGLISPGAPTMS